MKKIPLTRGKFALVDDADYEWLMQWKWCAVAANRDKTDWYAATGCPQIFMHRLILNAPANMKVDHHYGNGLNNQRYNLRLCNNVQNQGNRKPQKSRRSSIYKGIHWNKQSQKWVAQIVKLGHTTYLGSYSKEKDAAKAYDKAARLYFGEFARTNF
jgi:hypothetical protein